MVVEMYMTTSISVMKNISGDLLDQSGVKFFSQRVNLKLKSY